MNSGAPTPPGSSAGTPNPVSAAERPLEQLSKAELVQLIQATESAANVGEQNTASMLNEMNKKLDVMMEKLAELDALKRELAECKSEMETMKAQLKVQANQIKKCNDDQHSLHDIVMGQQRFMEQVDARQRQCKAVIMGLSEESDILGNDDIERVNCVLRAIDPNMTPNIVGMKRLGNANAAKKRPLLIELSTKAERDSITDKAKHLKDSRGASSQTLKKVFIKRDMHPAARKEHARLKKVMKDERQKPENAGTNIVYDHKRGVLTRDGLIIDSFKPFSFL